MQLRRFDAQNPDLKELNRIVEAMHLMLEDTENALEYIVSFQGGDGAFNLLDSCKVPGEAVFDYCNMPTFIGTAILMKEYLRGNKGLSDNLKKALYACVDAGLHGHGYDKENGRIDALNVLIKGDLKRFLETEWEMCPEFHNLVNNILHRYDSLLRRKCTKGVWGEDYGKEWRRITDGLEPDKRLYVAYGSNMNRKQMKARCPYAQVVGPAYLENWELDMPHYANIVESKGKRTPALVWEITKKDENKLNRYEGYPDFYEKLNILITVNGRRVSAMAYVMTDKYKDVYKVPRKGYTEQILEGYKDAGFDVSEFNPRRMI